MFNVLLKDQQNLLVACDSIEEAGKVTAVREDERWKYLNGYPELR